MLIERLRVRYELMLSETIKIYRILRARPLSGDGAGLLDNETVQGRRAFKSLFLAIADQPLFHQETKPFFSRSAPYSRGGSLVANRSAMDRAKRSRHCADLSPSRSQPATPHRHTPHRQTPIDRLPLTAGLWQSALAIDQATMNTAKTDFLFGMSDDRFTKPAGKDNCDLNLRYCRQAPDRDAAPIGILQ